MIRTCSCKHKAQDELHGLGQRVYNVVPRKDGASEARCTVCGTVVQVAAKKVEDKKSDKKEAA